MEKTMGSIVHRCPSCKGTEAHYDYGSKTIICRKCGKPLKNFERDATEYVYQKIMGSNAPVSYSTKKIRVKDLKGIPTVVSCEDTSASPETFNLLKEMMKRIDAGPYTWDEMEVWVTTHPSSGPYLRLIAPQCPKHALAWEVYQFIVNAQMGNKHILGLLIFGTLRNYTITWNSGGKISKGRTVTTKISKVIENSTSSKTLR